MPTKATNFGSGSVLTLAAMVVFFILLTYLAVQRLTLLPRNPYREFSSLLYSERRLSIRSGSKARPAARDSDFKHRVFGDKTRNRGTPLSASIVGSPQKTSSATIRTVRRHLYFVRRELQALTGRASPSMMWGNPPPRPHPRKCRFAQGRRDSTAVQIPSRDFLGLSKIGRAS